MNCKYSWFCYDFKMSSLQGKFINSDLFFTPSALHVAGVLLFPPLQGTRLQRPGSVDLVVYQETIFS